VSSRVKDVMTSDVVTVGEMAGYKDIIAVMRERRVSAVPVLDESDRLIGIVSEADLIPLETGDDPRRHMLPWHPSAQFVARRADDVMTSDVVTLSEEADVSEAARLMLQRHI